MFKKEKVWELLLCVKPFLCSLEERESVFVFCCSDKKKKKVKKKKESACTYRKRESARACVRVCVSWHICVSTAGWAASCPISVRADMIRRQIASLLVSRWPLAFALEGEKRSKRWHSATFPLIPRHHEDTDPVKTRLNTHPAFETHTPGDIALKEEEEEKNRTTAAAPKTQVTWASAPFFFPFLNTRYCSARLHAKERKLLFHCF